MLCNQSLYQAYERKAPLSLNIVIVLFAPDLLHCVCITSKLQRYCIIVFNKFLKKMHITFLYATLFCCIKTL